MINFSFGFKNFESFARFDCDFNCGALDELVKWRNSGTAKKWSD